MKALNLLTAIIVEDMPEAMEMLRADLERYCPDVSVVATANSVVTAAKLIRQSMPDIIFLDIALGDGTGFDLLEIFPDLKSNVIFITAFEEHALRAFRFSATDYLLKPIDASMLQKAVDKVRNTRISTRPSLDLLRESIKNPGTLPSRISLYTLDKISIVTISDIVRCEADGNNTWFFMNNGDKMYVTKTLKHFDDMLSDHEFLRVHQSHLVNFSYIFEFSKKDGATLRLKNGHEVPVSVRKKAEIVQLLEKMG
ncbi:MAG: response regulator transcription factor [Saprospiraceae bacterium]|nr:response regulator transcription factor [Saprospiraceae bacterium]